MDSLDADATIRDLVGRGVQFRDLEITGAGLEQAFVALTGCGAATAANGANAVTPTTIVTSAGVVARGGR